MMGSPYPTTPPGQNMDPWNPQLPMGNASFGDQMYSGGDVWAPLAGGGYGQVQDQYNYTPGSNVDWQNGAPTMDMWTPGYQQLMQQPVSTGGMPSQSYPPVPAADGQAWKTGHPPVTSSPSQPGVTSGYGSPGMPYGGDIMGPGIPGGKTPYNGPTGGNMANYGMPGMSYGNDIMGPSMGGTPNYTGPGMPASSMPGYSGGSSLPGMGTQPPVYNSPGMPTYSGPQAYYGGSQNPSMYQQQPSSWSGGATGPGMQMPATDPWASHGSVGMQPTDPQNYTNQGTEPQYPGGQNPYQQPAIVPQPAPSPTPSPGSGIGGQVWTPPPPPPGLNLGGYSPPSGYVVPGQGNGQQQQSSSVPSTQQNYERYQEQTGNSQGYYDWINSGGAQSPEYQSWLGQGGANQQPAPGQIAPPGQGSQVIGQNPQNPPVSGQPTTPGTNPLPMPGQGGSSFNYTITPPPAPPPVPGMGYTPGQAPQIPGIGVNAPGNAMNAPGMGMGLPTIGNDGAFAGMPGGLPPSLMNVPLITEQQQDQMVNQALSTNARTQAGNVRNNAEQMAGRGLSTASGAQGDYSQMQDLGRMMADTQASTSIPMQAQQMNANYMLQAAQNDLANRNANINAYGTQAAAQNAYGQLGLAGFNAQNNANLGYQDRLNALTGLGLQGYQLGNQANSDWQQLANQQYGLGLQGYGTQGNLMGQYYGLLNDQQRLGLAGSQQQLDQYNSYMNALNGYYNNVNQGRGLDIGAYNAVNQNNNALNNMLVGMMTGLV